MVRQDSRRDPKPTGSDQPPLIARRKRRETFGSSIRDVVAELEREHPDLAAEAPISSVALEIGEMVREMRLAAGMSQRDLAEAAGLHQSAISAIERGDGKDGPTYRKIRAIAKALGMDVAFVPLDVTARATRPISVQPENDRSMKRRALP